MTEALDEQARQLLSAAPASVKLPAGTGKTHSLAAAVKEAAKLGRRSLILTHTNAGVDVIRKRLSKFKVPSKLYRVDTITGWAFTLARSYQTIAGVVIPEAPDWTQSDLYLQGAINVAKASTIREVVSLSYDYLFVDEYQDCTLIQHEFILALHETICKTIVLGDPLQGIFGFGNNILIEWDDNVTSFFPPYEVELVPHRWVDTNPYLGQFTLDVRSELVSGNSINFGNRQIEGVRYVPGKPRTTLAEICYPLARYNESVAVLTDWPSEEDRIAQMLSGNFNVVEPITGNRMIERLNLLPEEGDVRVASWFAVTAKKFHIGLSGVDAPLLSKLSSGESVAGLRRKGLQEIIDALAFLQQNPSYQALLEVEKVPGRINGVRCSYREAWREIFRAIQYGIEEGTSDMVANLAVIRSRYKHMERQLPRLIVSRTLIVKGLEFDHVVISDIERFTDPRHLYVALTRARKSVTILGESPSIILQSKSG